MSENGTAIALGFDGDEGKEGNRTVRVDLPVDKRSTFTWNSAPSYSCGCGVNGGNYGSVTITYIAGNSPPQEVPPELAWGGL